MLIDQPDELTGQTDVLALPKAEPSYEPKQLPRIDYANHPAYGKMFKPNFGSQLTALLKVLPNYFKHLTALRSAGPRAAITVNNFDPQLLGPLVRNGSVLLLVQDREMERFTRGAKEYVDELRKKANGQKGVFERTVTLKEDEHFVDEFTDMLKRKNIFNVAKRYLGFDAEFPRSVTIRLKTGEVEHFADANEKNSQFAGYQTDIPSAPTLKCKLYINDVTTENGAFQYVKGSHKVNYSPADYAAMKATKEAGLDKTDPKSRALFAALPKSFQLKEQYGTDMLDSAEHAAELTECQRTMTSDMGRLIVFDGQGLHRDGVVTTGELATIEVSLVLRKQD
jgi:Phytanoyl-CoA dioxygenase (PhyH).